MKLTRFVQHYLPAGLTLGVGVLLSIIAFVAVWEWEQTSLRVRLRSEADKLETTLGRTVNENLAILQRMGDFYNAVGDIDRQKFETFAWPALYRYKGLRSLSWVPRVLQADRRKYQVTMRAQGQPNFQIAQQSSQGQMVNATQRPEYYPIAYSVASLERIQSNILGFDMGSESTPRLAMEKALQTGEMVATAPLRLIGTDRLGFVVFLPIYRNYVDDSSLAKRRENLQGFLLSSFAVEQIVRMALDVVDLAEIDFYLIDETAKEQRLLAVYNSQTQQLKALADMKMQTLPATGTLCQNLADCTRTIEIAGRQWALKLVPSDDYTGLEKHWRSLMTLMLGLLWTGIPVTYLLVSQRKRSQIEQLMEERTAQAQKLEKLVADRTAQTQELTQTLEELQQTQTQLIQSEKMSSLGQMVAGISHEINNPVSFIYGNITHAEEYIQELLEFLRLYQQHYPEPDAEVRDYAEAIDIEFITEDLPKLLSSMKVGATRIRQIVASLRNFSRLDEAEMKLVHLHHGIESSLLLLQHRLQGSATHPEIKAIAEYGNLPEVECYAGQMNQVFMNILANAIDALEGYGTGGIDRREEKDLLPNDDRSPIPNAQFPTIRIRTETIDSNFVRVRIIDNGLGMSEEVKSRIFDPFFTTKAVGKGTGLGLAIAYQIVVKKHGGRLQCFCEPGVGTEFCIEIPVRQPREQPSNRILPSAIPRSEPVALA